MLPGARFSLDSNGGAKIAIRPARVTSGQARRRLVQASSAAMLLFSRDTLREAVFL